MKLKNIVAATACAVAAALPAVVVAAAGDPLTFKAIDAQAIVQLNVPTKIDPAPVFECRYGDAGEWTPYAPPSTLNIAAGKTVSIRAATNGVQSLVGGIYQYGVLYEPRWSCSFLTLEGRMEASGDVTTLLSRQGVSEVPDYAFHYLFRNCKNIVTAPDLPAGKLGKYCCREMFSGCEALTNAPVLAATELGEGCYLCMFCACSGLTAAPALPARKLAASCYYMMFSSCTALETPPTLPATELAESCYRHMFQGCTSLKSAPALPATRLAESCYDAMFMGCKSLAVAPALPATELADGCYASMFYECRALTAAPVLPATTMKDACYSGMFSGCTSLKSAPALPATELAEGCYNAMFSDCSGLLEAPSLPARMLAVRCYKYMFINCTSLTCAPELPSDWVQGESYEGMFAGCTGLTEAPLLPSMNLFNSDGCYAYMFGGCTSLTNVTLMAKNEEPAFWRDYFENWLFGVAPHGTVRCPASLPLPENSASGLPDGWIREDIALPSPISVEPTYTFAVGVPIEPIVPTLAGRWYVSVVTGLPAGLEAAEWDTGVVTGTPTKTGVFQVTFRAGSSGQKDTIVTTEITVRKGGEYVVKAVVPVIGGVVPGKVSGAGTYAAGRKVTLKATANKGYVFSGWYDGDNLVSRLASYVLSMPAEDVTLTAKFLAAADDVAKVSFALPAEMTNGVTAADVPVDVSGCASLPTVKVKGLPTGLKFTAKDVLKKGSKTEVEHPANTIYGTPTKSGVYTVIATVTTAGKQTASASQTVVVRKAGEYVVKAEVPPVGGAVPGKVTGMGVYAKDKKVTLKATANKDYVFSGWYDGDVLLTQAASHVIDKMPESDVSLTAAFVTSDADKTSIAASVDGLALEPWVSKDVTQARATNVTVGVYLEWPVAASALSATTVKVSGLPSGLKFTAKNIYKKGSKTEVGVPANTIYGAPTAASKAGKPSQAKVTVTTAGRNKQVYQIDTTVDPLPSWAVGTFAGPSYDGGRGATALPGDVVVTNGAATVTIAASGKITAKQPVDGKATSFAANYFDAYDGESFWATLTAKVGKDVVTNEMAVSGYEGRATLPDGSDAAVTNGVITADRFDAWQYNWKAEPWKTIGKTFDKREVSYEEDGVWVTLKFAANGTAKVAGEFATYDEDGNVVEKNGKPVTVKATGSATLLPTVGEDGGTRYLVFVYLAPKGLAPHARCLEVGGSSGL